MLFGYLLYFNVLKENEYLLRTIEVEKEQKLIDTGLYGLVRHPMYLSVIIMFLSIPLILGSLYGFYIFLVFPLILIIRLHNEEKVLVKELKGYSKDLIKAGEQKTITVELDFDAFAHYSTAHDGWHIDDGIFEIMVGASSRDIKLKTRIKVEK